MRSLWYLPLTFLAGVHGFAIFAPYLALVFAALHLRSRSRARAAAVPVPVPVAIPIPVPALASIRR
jgi:hypothetical protein